MFVDWALITQTMERLETLSATETLAEITALRDMDPQLADTVNWLTGGEENARSFMQTRMPDLAKVNGPSLAQGDRVGVWRIAERIGAGGMGEVYRAERADGLFEQQVALKLAKVKSATLRERFDAERQRLAQLEHPNIARIVDGGAGDDGAPYMTMEFVDGLAIDAYAKANSLDRKARLGLIEKLCGAVAHAHGRLVLHRDIKHDNVLINQDGELRLIDFGVASLVNDTSVDATRGPLTIAYAAPEQLRGEPVSAQTDIFAIGMLAHLLEVGSLPKRLPDGGVAIDRGAIGDEDLAAILGKATAFDPADRYASADALAQDLRKFAGGFPVEARPVSGIARFGKLIGRNKPASIMGGAAIAAVVAGVIGIAVFAVEANREAEAARIAQQRGANTIEFYETLNAGFIDFVASIDPQSPAGSAMFGAIADLENIAQEQELSDPQKALETYIFLAEIYADAGQDLDASRIGEKLAAQSSELSYSSAFTLSSLVHPSEGIVETQSLLSRLDRLNDFFMREPVVHSFDIAHNKCVRARLTRANSDERICLDLATRHLATSDADSYAVAASNLTLSGYAMESARSLRRLEEAKKIAADALSFYRRDDRPTTVPEANFWIGLSDIAQIEEDWGASLEQLRSASQALETSEPAPFLEIAVEMELAQTHFALADYTAAQASAQIAADKAAQVYGADHYQVRDAQSEIARAIAKQGNVESARQILEDIINAEESSDNDPAAIKRYGEMLANIEPE